MNELRTGRAADIQFVKLDKKAKTGGQIRVYPKAKMYNLPKQPDKRKNPSQRAVLPIARNPHHDTHGTINLQLPNRQVRTVHVKLITRFNGKKVL